MTGFPFTNCHREQGEGSAGVSDRQSFLEGKFAFQDGLSPTLAPEISTLLFGNYP